MENTDPSNSVKNDSAALLDAFFDVSFARPITPRIVTWLYIFGVICIALIVLGRVLTGFHSGLMSGLIATFLAPVFFAIYVLAFRVGLEVALAVFRLADALKK